MVQQLQVKVQVKNNQTDTEPIRDTEEIFVTA